MSIVPWAWLLVVVLTACLFGLTRVVLTMRRRVESLVTLTATPKGDPVLPPTIDTAALDRLRGALGAIHDAVLVSDMEGRIVFRHDPVAADEGHLKVDVLTHQVLRDLLARAVAGESSQTELETYGPPRRTFTVYAAPLVDGAQRLGAVAVAEDITAERRLDAVRRDFVSNISHELRTPIGAMAVLAEALTDERSTTTMRALARRIEHEAHRVATLIEEVMSLAQVEANGPAVRERALVGDVIREAVDRVTPLSETKEVPVCVEPFDAALAFVGDRRQLVIALHNLIDNAVRYSDQGTTVKVRVGSGERFPDGRTSIALSVIDTGIGIPARDRARIFERFYRVDKARTRETGGTGLGLAIVRHVALNHEGEVSVDSLEGEGSTFTLRLPGGSSAVQDEHDHPSVTDWKTAG